MQEDVGARLAARRRELGLSQRELGRRSGVYYSDISRLERGDRAGAGRVRRLAEALGLDPETLEVVHEIEPARPRHDVERAMELVATVMPGMIVTGLMAELFPPGEWSAGARERGETMIRAELERAMHWGERVRASYAAARQPMAASAGVPSGEDEESLFLLRMQRELKRRSQA